MPSSTREVSLQLGGLSAGHRRSMVRLPSPWSSEVLLEGRLEFRDVHHSYVWGLSRLPATRRITLSEWGVVQQNPPMTVPTRVHHLTVAE